jgi:hypothetical protein
MKGIEEAIRKSQVMLFQLRLFYQSQSAPRGAGEGGEGLGTTGINHNVVQIRIVSPAKAGAQSVKLFLINLFQLLDAGLRRHDRLI